jgi:hypothetical protein
MHVVAQLTEYIRDHQDAGSQANGQTKNIDERNNFVSFQVPAGNLEIVFEHGLSLNEVDVLFIYSKEFNLSANV